MTNKVLPNALPNPVTALGYDGADFMPVSMMLPTSGKAGVPKILIPDRDPVRVHETFSSSEGNHDWTARCSYEVGEGLNAVIQLIAYGFGTVPAGGEVRWRFLFGGSMAWSFVALNTLAVWDRYQTFPVHFDLLTGETVSLESYNATGANCFFAGKIMGLEYVK